MFKNVFFMSIFRRYCAFVVDVHYGGHFDLLCSFNLKITKKEKRISYTEPCQNNMIFDVNEMILAKTLGNIIYR